MNKVTKAMENAAKEIDASVNDITRMSTKNNVRGEVLMEAGKLITGERAQDYGNFLDQMEAIAETFNALHIGVKGEPVPVLRGKDVARLMQILKLRRDVTSDGKDSAIDLCGYTALRAEAYPHKG